MHLPPEVFVHEAGHLVVGLHIGLVEQGIVFAGVADGEVAQAWFNVDSPENGIRRALAGLLSHIEILPETIPSHLLSAYRKSIVIDESHDSFSQISEEERVFLSGATSDMKIAHNYASMVCGGGTAATGEFIRKFENEVRGFVSDLKFSIRAVAEDIYNWLANENPKDNPMMLYSPARAKSLLKAQ